MTEKSERLLAQFEEQRPRLHAVAYRMLGSTAEADDAVQEAWLRMDRTDTGDIRSLPAWLTTVVARVCLNMLRGRASRREEPLERAPGQAGGPTHGSGGVLRHESGQGPGRLPGPSHAEVADPEQEMLLADSVGLALLVVLDALTPAERLAFVLHDMFAVPFDEIGPMIDRSPAAARQLASRARRRVKGSSPVPEPDLARRRRVVEAFLAASRGGDFEALVAVLHPDVVLHADRSAGPTPEPVGLRGARHVAQGSIAAAERTRYTGIALVDGSAGIVMAPFGRLQLVLAFTVGKDDEGRDKVTGIDIVADPERLRRVDIAVLEE